MPVKRIVSLIAALALLSAACLLDSPVSGSSDPPATTVEEAPPEPRSRTARPPSQAISRLTPFHIAQGTYYVRGDGGSTAQCDGRTNAPYTGTSQDCAWDHPFRALPPGGTPRIAGGDTLIIASGSYMMGYGAPETETACEPDGAFDCHMPPIPSGPDSAHPTRILGQGWESGCANPPELWGTERAWYLLNLIDASNVELACLELTDHSDCVEDHTGGLACQRDNPPFGPWAAVGLYAEDSSHVHLRDLNIHGFAVGGVHAGRLTDWTVVNVRIAANGWAGWDGDIDGDDGNAGTLTFRHWTVEWNGCAETYPGEQPTGCWAQSAGGYGDGIGTGETGGTWVVEDSAFLHNTSDGLDLLYTRRADSSVTIRRTIAEGNAGDQIKTTGPTYVENVIAVSNCGFFQDQPFTFQVDNCRAGGSAMAFYLRASNYITVVNSTITGEGDCLIITEGEVGTVTLRNNIFQGNPEFGGGGDTTCFTWYGTPADPFTIDHSIINGLKTDFTSCPADSLCDVAPGLVNAGIDTFDAHLLESSPAIDGGTPNAAPVDDFSGRPRDAHPDIGAYEWWEALISVFLPAVVKNQGGG